MEETKKTEKKEPVWVLKERCKCCAKCVRECPAGVLGMATDARTIYGQMIAIDRPDLCVGCNKCENACPDFAIFVAGKDEYAFPKITKDAKERQAKILANDCQSLPKKGDEDEKA